MGEPFRRAVSHRRLSADWCQRNKTPTTFLILAIGQYLIRIREEFRERKWGIVPAGGAYARVDHRLLGLARDKGEYREVVFRRSVFVSG